MTPAQRTAAVTRLSSLRVPACPTHDGGSGGGARLLEMERRLCDTSRETATKVLGEFADRGLLRRGRGRITLLDIDGLAGD